MTAMSELIATMLCVLQRPEPAALVSLQEALLAEVAPGAARAEALATAGEFHGYLLDLRGRLSARQYSQLAAWLDVAAMGLVAFENFMADKPTDLKGLITGLLAEGAMVVANRQHIKAWDVEAQTPHDHAAWYLRGAYWRLSESTLPELPSSERLARLRSLVTPAQTVRVSSERIVALGRLFQVLLLIQVSQLRPRAQSVN